MVFGRPAFGLCVVCLCVLQNEIKCGQVASVTPENPHCTRRYDEFKVLFLATVSVTASNFAAGWLSHCCCMAQCQHGGFINSASQILGCSWFLSLCGRSWAKRLTSSCSVCLLPCVSPSHFSSTIFSSGAGMLHLRELQVLR